MVSLSMLGVLLSRCGTGDEDRRRDRDPGEAGGRGEVRGEGAGHLGSGRGEGAGHLAACHHLHLASSTWTRGPGLARGREDAASAVLGGLMVVTGGWDGARLLDSVEVFSSEAEQWQEVGSQQFNNHVTMSG